MRKPLIIFVLAVLALAGWLLFKNSQPAELVPSQAGLIKPHFYQKPAIDISKINLKIFYVVPNNLQVATEWKDNINSVMPNEIKFHAVQFHNTSQLLPEIYPEPVVLEHEDTFYDTNNTNNGNPEGLRNIVPELERRFPKFLEHTNDTYLAIAIIYEGVGASGAPNAMILSRTFLSKDEYRLSGGSLFYHELAHTFGVPDFFDLVSNQPNSDDVMGAGRYKPLETNYFGPDLQVDLGLTLSQ